MMKTIDIQRTYVEEEKEKKEEAEDEAEDEALAWSDEAHNMPTMPSVEMRMNYFIKPDIEEANLPPKDRSTVTVQEEIDRAKELVRINIDTMMMREEKLDRLVMQAGESCNFTAHASTLR